MIAMQKWKYTSYENGQAVTRSDLSWSEAVRALDDMLVRMQAHQHGKRAALRPLGVAESLLPPRDRG